MSPEAVIRRLDVVCQKWWFFTLLTTTVLAGCVCFAVGLTLLTVDAFVRLNQIGLAVALAAWAATTLAVAFIAGRRLLRNHRGLEGAARRVEAEFPELGSSLINIVQLAEDKRVADQAFRAAAVNDAAAHVGQFPFDSAASHQSRRRRFLYCMQTPRDLAESLLLLAALVGVACVCYRCIPAWGSAAGRLMAPWQFVPAVGKVEIVSVLPGDVAGDGRRRAGSRRRDQQPEKPAACRPLAALARGRAGVRTAHGRGPTARPLPIGHSDDHQAVAVSPGDRRFADAGLHGADAAEAGDRGTCRRLSFPRLPRPRR